jgi:hypothetical protein
MRKNAPPTRGEENADEVGQARAAPGGRRRCDRRAHGRHDRARADGHGERNDQGRVDLRRAAQRRRLVAGPRSRPSLRPEGARQEGRHDLQGERPRGTAGLTGDRQPRARREQDHLRDLLRLHGRDGGGREEVPGRLLRARYRLQDRQELRQLLRRRRGRDLPLRDRRGCRDQEQHGRLHRPVPDPRDHPARERLRTRRPAREADREGEARLDEVVVRPGEGAEGRREPGRGRRGRDRPERRQPGGGAVRPVEGAAVGRLQQQLAEVRADVLARGRGLRLGPLLPEARPRGGERDVEDGQLLGLAGRRVHAALAVWPEGRREDEGHDRNEAGADRQGHVLRVPGPALRPVRQAPRPEGEEDDLAGDPERRLAGEGHRVGFPPADPRRSIPACGGADP